eukprot:jgi/Undpi1/4945/HiC_scaffold_19.g08297.m1
MPSAKKERSKKKKAAKRAGPPGLEAATARIKAANATEDLSNGLEAFLSIDLPGSQSMATPAVGGAKPDANAAATTAAATVAPDHVHLEIRAPKDLAEGDTQSMYDLLKANMHDMYVEAGWGWDAAEKRREMEHRDARFLIARCRGSGGDEGGAAAAVASPQPMASCAVGSEAEGDAGAVKASSTEVRAAAVEDTKSLASVSDDSAVRCDGNPVGGGARVEDGASDNAVNVKEEAVLPAGEESERGRLAGFCHFRFAWDEDENEDGEGVGGKEDVLYVYELQVAPWTKRRGLGRRMMQALELLANRHGMSKVMLTVFKENKQAMSFYTKKRPDGHLREPRFQKSLERKEYEAVRFDSRSSPV